ncbi:MAG: hypothetical protein ACPGSI_13905, partial [Pikeienuella sp.]
MGQLLPAGKSSSGPQVNAFSETLGSPLAQRFEGPAAPHTATAQLALSPSDAAISGAGQGGIQAAQPRTAPGMTVAGDNVPVQEGEFAVIEAMTPEQVEQIVASPETQAEVRKHPDKRSFLKGQVQEIAAGVESGQIPPQHFRQYVAVAQQVADIMYEDAPKQLNAALIQRAKLAGLVPQSQGGDGRFEIFMANNGNMPDPKSMMEIRDPTTGNIIFSERPADQGGQNDPLGVASPESMIYNIDAILNDPALDFSTGWLQFMQGVPGTDARRFGARTKQLDGKAFLRAFDMLKGGGHITEIEGRKATEAIGRLDSGQKAEDYRGALMELRAILSMGLDRQAGLAQHREITARAGGLQTPEAIVGMTPEQIRGLNLVDIP